MLDHFYEDTEDRQDKEEQVTLLREKQSELEEQLTAVEAALRELGCYENSEGIFAPTPTSRQPQAGIQINNKLSFRGKQKALEYFDRLDEDKDGFLTFDDFRAMRSNAKPVGIVHEHHYRHWDAWKMHLAASGVGFDELGRVTKDEFVKYRVYTEVPPRKQPLEPELLRAGLGVLPKDQQLWVQAKTLIEELIVDREYHEENSRNANAAATPEDLFADIMKPDQPLRSGGVKMPLKSRFYEEKLNIDEMMFVLTNLNIVYPRTELIQLQYDRALREKTIEHLTAKNLRKNFAEGTEQLQQFISPKGHLRIPREPIVVTVDDIKSCKVSYFIAWLFSGRPPPSRSSGIYRTLLLAKYNSYRVFRETNRLFRFAYQIAYHLRQRSVFRDFEPPAKVVDKSDRCNAGYTFIIGKGANIESPGIEVTGRLLKISDIDRKCTRMKVPKDSGTTIAIDLQLRSKANREDVRAASEAVKLLLRLQLEPELRKLSAYKSLSVFPAVSEADGSEVLRIALVFKRNFSLDAFLTYVHLPYTFTDLVQDISVDVKINMTIDDLFYNTFSFLDTSFGAKFDIKVFYVKNTISAILDRAIQALGAHPTSKQSTKPPKDERSLTVFESFMKLRERLPPVVDWLKGCLTYVRGFKASQVKMRFKKVSELLHRMGSLFPWFKWNAPPEVGTAVGYINERYEHWRAGIKQDSGGIFEQLAAFLEFSAIKEDAERQKKKEAAKKRFAELSAGGSIGSMEDTASEGAGDKNNSSPQKEKGLGVGSQDSPSQSSQSEATADHATLIEKLRRLGITGDSIAFLEDDREPRDPSSYTDFVQDSTSRQDVQTYMAWEKVHKVCLGLNSVVILSGKAELTLGCSGVDLVDLIPEVRSLQEVKDDIAARKARAIRLSLAV